MATHISATVTYQLSTSEEIDPLFFGGNLLFDRDMLDGTFAAKVQNLNLNLLRFPGGGIAEDHFDITNPDALAVPEMSEYETFSDFMSYCFDNDLTPAIVIPTKRYVDDIAQGEADVTDFVTSIANGDYGVFDEIFFEVGNEFYASTAGHDPLGDGEYSQIASRFSVAIDAVGWDGAKVAVQAGRTKAQNANIMKRFNSSEEIEAVDSIIVHQYPWSLDPIDGRVTKMAARIEEWEAAGFTVSSFMSEWNIGSSSDEDASQHDYGLAQNPALLELVYRSVVAGIDYGAVWGIQQNTKTTLTRNETNPGVYAAGELFSLMSEVLPGKTALQLGQTDTVDPLLNVYAYEDDTSFAIFIAARDFDEANGPMTVDLDLQGLGSEFVDATGIKISSDEPVDAFTVEAVMTAVTPDVFLDDFDPRLRVQFEKDHEVIRLILNKPVAQTDAKTETGGNDGDFITGGQGDDDLRGRGGNDFISAHDGDDVLRGGGNTDKIDGGNGQDTIFGGSGRDSIDGGGADDQLNGDSGRDHIEGGSGDDTIFGGNGRDFLRGGDGDDRIIGDSGNDRLWGGAGADIFVFEDGWDMDRIYDFQAGVDLIDMTALSMTTSFDDLSISTIGKSTLFTATEGSLLLQNVAFYQIGADDFLF